MAFQIKYAGCLFFLLILAEFSYAAPVVQEANFYRTFDGKDYYGPDLNFDLQLSTMSNDGKVVAFYGTKYFNGSTHWELFIHNFESTAEPVPVTLPASFGLFNTNAGLVSNSDGSRIFFIARNTTITYASAYYFSMVNTLTGEVTILLDYVTGNIEDPQDIATDAAGDYLYFNESDNGDRGDLWRIPATAGAVPEMVIDADTIGHPSGGVGRFIDNFDVSDDGNTIAFFIEGRIPSDGSPTVRTNKELFVKTDSGIRFLTNNDENGKDDLVISGDGSTIVYATFEWMVTTPDAPVESQIQIEPGYHSCGARPDISQDGSLLFGLSNPNGVSDCRGYLIKTDGSGRQMVEPGQISMHGTYDGLHLSDDGTRVFFKNREYVYPDEWYNMTAGVFGANLWPTQVPKVTDVSYPSNMFSLLENNENFEVKIGVSDPQGDVTLIDVMEYLLYPEGYDAYHYGPISMYMNTTPSAPNLYTARGRRGSAWPDRVPILTARFSVEDENGNVSYVDTLVQPPVEAPSLLLVLPAILNGAPQ